MIFNKKIVGCCLICILLIVTVFQFTGCASKEEIEELENMYDKSIEYYKNKYDLDNVSIKKHYIISTNNGPVPQITGPKCYVMSDGTKVIWTKDKKFVDDRQSDEIQEDIKSKILDSVIKKYENEFGVKIKLDNQIILSNDLNFKNEEVCYFNKKYDGDIKKFLESENKKFALKKKDIIFVCNENQSYKENIISLATELKKYFNSEFSVFAVNDKRAKSYEKKDSITPIYEHIYDDGCYGAYNFNIDDDENWSDNWYEKKFIEIIPGFFASYSGPNYQLKDGDIVFSKMPENELIQKELNKKTQEKLNSKDKTANSNIQIYKAKFSDELKQNLKSDDYMTFKIDYEKLDSIGLYECYYGEKDNKLCYGVSLRKRNIFGLIHISIEDLEKKYYYMENYKLDE